MTRVLLACWLCLAFAASSRAQTTVFAASSLADALPALAGEAGAAGQDLQFIFVASSTAARQIEAGAAATLFISADEDWVRFLAQRGLVEGGSERDLAGNSLVLVAPADSPLGTTALDPAPPLAEWLGKRRLALGDPAHVPAGRYAQQALTRLGLWDSVRGRLAPADSARTALRYVASGECPLGIVYRTDGLRVPGVKVLGEFPVKLHAPVRYRGVLLKPGANDRGRAFLDFLQSSQARRLWAAHGFVP